jgi:amino acid adenylation domain-containing protein
MTLGHLFDDAATDFADREALVGLERSWSWQQAATAVTSLAHALVGAGIRPGERVAVARLRDAESTVAIHGILRAGAIAVPVDPMAPPAAACSVLADAQVTGIVGDKRTVGALDLDGLDLTAVVVAGDDLADGWLSWDDATGETQTAQLPDPSLDDPAYIIYTSGSTGRPKGIVHTHGSGLAYAERATRAHRLIETDRVAGIPPLHFDQATFDLFAAPLARAAVVVMGEAHARFPASLVARSEAERVTVWYSVPSLFRQLVDRGGMDQRDLNCLRLVLYGGEVYPGGALNQLHSLVPQAAVTNVYGPAELNECTNQPIDLPVDQDVETPIGRPWTGVDICIMDQGADRVAPGSTGELLVSAPTMMREYWRQPDLTQRSICTDDQGRRWYRTGDLVSAGDDGLLTFHGRSDNQIKVRGVRVELEAVEAVVADAPGVADAVVGPVAGGESLEAVFIASSGATIDLAELKRHCAARLSQVTVPRSFHPTTHFPTTPSGKIDRAAVRAGLAAPEGAS